MLLIFTLLILILIVPALALSKSAPSSPTTLKFKSNPGKHWPKTNYSSTWNKEEKTIDVFFPGSSGPCRYYENVSSKQIQILYKEFLDLHKAVLAARGCNPSSGMKVSFIIMKPTSIRISVFENGTKRKLFTYIKSRDRVIYKYLESAWRNSRPKKNVKSYRGGRSSLGKAYYQPAKKKK